MATRAASDDPLSSGQALQQSERDLTTYMSRRHALHLQQITSSWTGVRPIDLRPEGACPHSQTSANGRKRITGFLAPKRLSHKVVRQTSTTPGTIVPGAYQADSGARWHHYEREDEPFPVHKSRPLMRFRERNVLVEEGEFLIVPRRWRSRSGLA